MGWPPRAREGTWAPGGLASRGPPELAPRDRFGEAHICPSVLLLLLPLSGFGSCHYRSDGTVICLRKECTVLTKKGKERLSRLERGFLPRLSRRPWIRYPFRRAVPCST